MKKKESSSMIIPLIYADIRVSGYYSSDIFINDSIPPVPYCDGSYIWFIRDSFHWYLLQHNGDYYAFDIREVVRRLRGRIGDDSLELIDRLCFRQRETFREFIDKMGIEGCYIDVNQSIAILGTTDSDLDSGNCMSKLMFNSVNFPKSWVRDLMTNVNYKFT